MRALFVFLILNLSALSANILVSQEDKPFSYKDDRELFERVVRVEEGILRMQKFLDLVLSQIDKRFEQMQKTLDRNAEQRDKRFEDLKWYMGHRFNTIYWILGILSGILVAIFGSIFRKIDHNTKEIQKISSKLDYNTKEIQVIDSKLDILLGIVHNYNAHFCN